MNDNFATIHECSLNVGASLFPTEGGNKVLKNRGSESPPTEEEENTNQRYECYLAFPVVRNRGINGMNDIRSFPALGIPLPQNKCKNRGLESPPTEEKIYELRSGKRRNLFAFPPIMSSNSDSRRFGMSFSIIVVNSP